MPDLPKSAVKLYLGEHIQKRVNRPAGRIIQIGSLHQQEETADYWELVCPICEYIQDAPGWDNVEYECPRCKWRYLTNGGMLAIWSPTSVGVTTHPLKPGQGPYDHETIHGARLDSGSDEKDPEKVQHYYDKSKKKFLETQGTFEEDTWDKKIISGGTKLNESED